MYGDPRETHDQACEYRVMQHIAGRTHNVDEFTTLEEAAAFIGNTDYHYGNELSVDEVDLRTGKIECVHSAEWDEDIQRFLVA